jgi:hypothetical protein
MSLGRSLAVSPSKGFVLFINLVCFLLQSRASYLFLFRDKINHLSFLCRCDTIGSFRLVRWCVNNQICQLREE